MLNTEKAHVPVDCDYDLYSDGDVTILTAVLKDAESVIYINRMPEKSNVAVNCTAFVDFENRKIGFFKAYLPDATPEVAVEKEVPFDFICGHKYLLSFEKRDSLYLTFTVTDAFTFESDEICSNSILCGAGWGKRSYSIKKGSLDIVSFKTYSTQPYNPILAILGDSYVEGNSLTVNKDNRYAMKIKNALGGDVFIFGQGGATSGSGKIWVEKYIPNMVRPTYILLAFGMNDRDYEKWLDNIKCMINKCLECGMTPILATTPPSPHPSYPDDVHIKMNDWIRNSGFTYLDIAEALSLNNDRVTPNADKLLGDKVHPNIDGHDTIFKRSKIDLPFLYI